MVTMARFIFSVTQDKLVAMTEGVNMFLKFDIIIRE